MNKYPLIRMKNIVIQETGEEVLVYDMEENRAFCLNETSALVWQMCDGKTSISEMVEELDSKLDETVSEELVWLAISKLNDENLLVNDNDELQTSFNGLSRREVIRKVGLTSMVALPLVSSLAAPNAASAQSCVQIGGNVGSTIACPASDPTCSCAVVIGGPGSSACCPGLTAVPGICTPISMTTSQTCTCVCGVVVP